MRLWRISDHADLSGEGGLLASGRCHTQGNRIIYLADHPASALVEVLVHLEVDSEDIPEPYQLLAVELPDNTALEAIELKQLPNDWHDQLSFTRKIGDAWLRENRVPLLRVPSAIIPFATNWLLNPAHREAAGARVADVIRAPFDRRLFV
jgi:RES domain-containing protein